MLPNLFTIFNRDYPAGAIINDEECPYVIAHFKMNEEKRGNVFKIVWFLVIIGGIQTWFNWLTLKANLTNFCESIIVSDSL